MERRTRSYLQLIKPGITLTNTMTAAAGFLLAKSNHGFHLSTFLGLVAGVALIVASACVVNNIIDRDLDRRMKRTRGREVASGNISVIHAAVFATALGAAGFWALAAFTNGLVLLLGLVCYIWYIVIYAVAKRTTPLSTIIGGVCGALPPVAGYVAVTGSLDIVAFVLFALMMVWQLPHFYAIAIFRRSDYESAGLPVWSVRYGIKSTKVQIMAWSVVFAVFVPLLFALGVAGWTYLIVMGIVSLYWVWQGARFYMKEDDVQWAKRMFGISLIVLLTFSAAIASSRYLP